MENSCYCVHKKSRREANACPSYSLWSITSFVSVCRNIVLWHPAEKLALSGDRTSSAAAQRNSKVSSSLRWWISAACAIYIIYVTPALLGALLAESEMHLTNLCSHAPIWRSFDSLWIIYSNSTCLIRQPGWSEFMLFPSKVSQDSRHQQHLTAHFYYSAIRIYILPQNPGRNINHHFMLCYCITLCEWINKSILLSPKMFCSPFY